jgi:hypothetical protein
MARSAYYTAEFLYYSVPQFVFDFASGYVVAAVPGFAPGSGNFSPPKSQTAAPGYSDPRKSTDSPASDACQSIETGDDFWLALQLSRH